MKNRTYNIHPPGGDAPGERIIVDIKRINDIRDELEEMAVKEAMGLWRLARKADKKGCSTALIEEIRIEANWLHTTAQNNPERIIDWTFEYEHKLCVEK